MGRSRSKATYNSSYGKNFDKFFTIPDGFPTPNTVGYAAPGAFGSSGPTGGDAGPITRNQLLINYNHQDRTSPVYAASSGNNTQLIDKGLFYGIDFHANIQLYRSAVEGLSSAKLIYFYIYETVNAAVNSGDNTTIKLTPGPDFNQFQLGSVTTAGDNSTDILVNISVIGHTTNEVEKGYLGRQQNSDGSVDFTHISSPTGPLNDNAGGPDYYIYDIANHDPTYGQMGTFIGLFFEHKAGATINAQPALGGVSAANFESNGTVLAQWSSFGYANVNGGGSGALGSAGGSRFKNCFIGDATDGPRVSGDLGFTDCVIGPELGGTTGAAPHSDGFQNVGGAHNDPTGDVWLDFTNQQQLIVDSNSSDPYANAGYKTGSYKASWVAGQSYTVGDQVIVMHPGPLVATCNSTHTAGGSYNTNEASHWTEASADLLHMPGQFWTWTKHCSMLGFEATGLDTYSFEQNHAPYFLASNSASAGPIQNFLVWNCFLSGGQSTILDATSVNSDNYNQPNTQKVDAPGTRGIGGVNGMIVGGESVVQFAYSAGANAVAELAVAYSSGNVSSGLTTIHTNRFISDGTNFTIGTGSTQDQTQVVGDAVYSTVNGNYTVHLVAAFDNPHVVGEALVAPEANAGQIGLLVNGPNGGVSVNDTVLYTGCFIGDGTNFTIGPHSMTDQCQANGDATYSSAHGYYIVNLIDELSNGHSAGEAIVTATNGNPGQLLPNVSAATDADSNNLSPILQNTNYNYWLVTAVPSAMNTTQVVLSSTYDVILGYSGETPPTSTYGSNTITFGPMPSAGRTDAATVTGDPTVITDNSITAWDIGKPVIGTGVPAGATVLSVNPTNKTLTLSAATTSNSLTSVKIGGAQLTFGGETVTVTQQVSTDSSGNYTVNIFPGLQNMHAMSDRSTQTNGSGITSRVTTDLIASSETRWRELPRSIELSGDLTSLDLTYNYWGTVVDQYGNLVTLTDAMRNSNSGAWNGWPKDGQRAGEWETTSL